MGVGLGDDERAPVFAERHIRSNERSSGAVKSREISFRQLFIENSGWTSRDLGCSRWQLARASFCISRLVSSQSRGRTLLLSACPRLSSGGAPSAKPFSLSGRTHNYQS